MARYKGRASAKSIAHNFPHVVEIPVPLGGLGKRLDAMHYLRWCFADSETAAAFAGRFAELQKIS